MSDVPEPDRPTDDERSAGAPVESALLDELEADLAAVETAIAAIDRISAESRGGAEGRGGDRAAAEIAAAVSVDRLRPS